MSSNKEVKKDHSIKQEIRIPCLKCSIRTGHKVFASRDETDFDDDSGIHWFEHYQIVMCLGCETISFRKTWGDSESYCVDQYGHQLSYVNEELYPPRIEGRKGIDEHLYELPLQIRKIYVETHQAFNANLPVLAGIGLRALVEAVCKEKNAEGKALSNKIDYLADNKILTTSGQELLHKIRTLGNKSAHEVQPHSLKQLALAMDVVESLLKDVYIYPNLVKNSFGE